MCCVLCVVIESPAISTNKTHTRSPTRTRVCVLNQLVASVSFDCNICGAFYSPVHMVKNGHKVQLRVHEGVLTPPPPFRVGEQGTPQQFFSKKVKFTLDRKSFGNRFRKKGQQNLLVPPPSRRLGPPPLRDFERERL